MTIENTQEEDPSTVYPADHIGGVFFGSFLQTAQAWANAGVVLL